MNLERVTPRNGNRTTGPTTGPRAQTAFGRAYRKNASLLPEKASVSAFMRWMRDLGYVGEQLLVELHIEFCEVVELMGGDPLPLKRFGRALSNAGYPPFMTDREKDGKRWRPMAVKLTGINPEMAVIATNLSPIATAKTTNATTAVRLTLTDRAYKRAA